MIKKNYHGGLKLLSTLLFMLLFVGLCTISSAYTTVNGAIQLSVSEMQEVVTKISVDNYFSGDILVTTTDTFNRWARLQAQTQDFSAQNIIFFKPYGVNGRLQWALSNATSGTLPYLYIGSSNNQALYPTTTYAQIQMNYFNGWLTNTSGDYTGASTGPIPNWYITNTSAGSFSQSNTSNLGISMYDQNNTNTGFSIGLTTGGDAYSINIPNLVALSQTYVVYSYTSTFGRNTYFLSNYLTFHNSGEAPPAPTPTPGGGGGDSPGGGSVDLTETNGKIDDVKEEVTQQGEAIVNQLSGDKAEIIESQQQSTEAITGSIDDAFDPDTSKIDSGEIDLSIGDYEIDEQTDPTSNFFTWLLEQIQDILTIDGDETLEFDFLDEHYILNSSDFSGPEGALKTFLVAYFTFAVGFLTALDIRKIIEQFKNGNIEAIASDDINANIV